MSVSRSTVGCVWTRALAQGGWCDEVDLRLDGHVPLSRRAASGLPPSGSLRAQVWLSLQVGALTWLSTERARARTRHLF